MGKSRAELVAEVLCEPKVGDLVTFYWVAKYSWIQGVVVYKNRYGLTVECKNHHPVPRVYIPNSYLNDPTKFRHMNGAGV